MPPGGPAGKHPVERLGVADLRHRQALTLLSGGDRYRAQPIGVETLGLGALGSHRPKYARPELAGLFHQPVEPHPFDRREQQPKIGLLFGGPQQPHRGQRHAAATALCKPAQPLAVACVEARYRSAGGEPQHVAQTVHLSRIEFDRIAGYEPLREVEASGWALGQASLRSQLADRSLSGTNRRAKIRA